VIDLTNLTDEQQRHAEALASDELLDAVFDSLIAKYTQMWRGSPKESSSGREHLYLMVLATEELRGELRNVAANRKIAAYNNRSRK
jgi:hypothetical protein